MTTRQALIFRHMREDTARLYPALLRERGFDVTFHDWQDGEAPSTDTLKRSDMLLVLGGAQQVWEEDIHPWLVDEKAIIANWVNGQAKPYVGLCLGHQLLASSLGGDVGLSVHKEIGLCAVDFRPETADTKPFRSFEGSTPVTQWHEAEVLRAPEGASVLAMSAACGIQMLGVGDHAFSTQFHHEWDVPTVNGWLPQWQTAMDQASGQPGTYQGFRRQMAEKEPHLSSLSTGLFESFMDAQGW